MTYIHKDIKFFESEALPDSYEIGTTKGEFFNGAYILLNEEQELFRTNNPTATPLEVFRMILEPGVEEYIPTEAEILTSAKIIKTIAIKEYNDSDVVNTVSLDGVVGWLDAPMRSNYRNSLEAAEVLEESTVAFELSHKFFVVPLAVAKKLLAKVQRYADACAMVTKTHLATVEGFTNKAEVDAYDHTAGYPATLTLDTTTL